MYEDFLNLNSFSINDLLHRIGALHGRFFASTRKEVLSQPKEALWTKALSTTAPVQGHQWLRSALAQSEKECLLVHTSVRRWSPSSYQGRMTFVFAVQVNRVVGTVMNAWFIFISVTKPRLRRRNQSIFSIAHYSRLNITVKGRHLFYCRRFCHRRPCTYLLVVFLSLGVP